MAFELFLSACSTENTQDTPNPETPTAPEPSLTEMEVLLAELTLEENHGYPHRLWIRNRIKKDLRGYRRSFH